MKQTAVPALVIRRILPAPPETVFDAWTTPETASEILAPENITVCELQMDARDGGKYRFGMRRSDDSVWYVRGEYRDVARPHRLSMTWIWEEDEPSEERETLLTLEFNRVDEGTELILTHEYLASEESRANHTYGWNSMLEKLERYLTR